MKKKFLGFILFLFIGAFLSGCTKRAENNGKLVPEGTQIEFQIWTAQEKEFVSALIQEFISQSKTTGIIPKVITFSNDAELQMFLTEKMAEGTVPDVIFTEGSWIYKNQKKITPLENDENFQAAAFKNTFVRVANETLLQGDKILGVPMGVDTLGTIYNQEHLIDRLETRNSPAKTWTEFKDDAEKLTQEDNSFERFKFSGSALGRLDNIHYGFELLENIMLQYGTKFFSPDNLVASFATTKGINAEGRPINAGISAIEFFLGFANPRNKNYTWNDSMAKDDSKEKDFKAFVTGKTSIVFGYSRDIEKIEDLIAKTSEAISPQNIQTDFLPQVHASGDKEILAKTYSFAVPRGAENGDISWKFLQFAAQKENQNSFFQNTGIPSPRLDLISEQGQHELLGVFARQAKFARSHIFPIDRDELKKEFIFLITNLNTGRYKTDKMVQKLEKKITEKVKSYHKREREIQNNVKKSQKKSDENMKVKN